MKIFAILILIAALVAGGYFWKLRRDRAEAVPIPPKTATVERGSITLAVSATGRVVANLDVDIKCKASGQVMKLPYDVSDSVEQGKLLVELDPVDEQRAVSQAEVALAAAEARLAQAKRGLDVAEKTLTTNQRRADAALTAKETMAKYLRVRADRIKKVVDKQFTSVDEFDAADANAVQAAMEAENSKIKFAELKTEESALELKRQDVKLAEAEVASDTIALNNARQRLKDTAIFAPISGVVSARNVQIGQIIASGISNIGGGTTVLTLSDLSRLFLLASIDESDIGKLAVGQDVRITTDSHPERKFDGKVVRVATRGVNSSNVVTFEVKIEIISGDKQLLKPEMTANVEIIAQEKSETLLVPVEAVARKQGKRVVEVVGADGQVAEREVEVGISDGVRLEVLSGLTDGEAVVVRASESESRFRANDSNKKSASNPFKRTK